LAAAGAAGDAKTSEAPATVAARAVARNFIEGRLGGAEPVALGVACLVVI
jgi:hypothetical protein